MLLKLVDTLVRPWHATCCLPSAAAVCCLLPQSAAHLNIAHTKLTSLAGLSGLQVINGDLIAWDNQNLAHLQGLGPITQLYGKLWMDSNPLLQDMTGLEVGARVVLGVKGGGATPSFTCPGHACIWSADAAGWL